MEKQGIFSQRIIKILTSQGAINNVRPLSGNVIAQRLSKYITKKLKERNLYNDPAVISLEGTTIAVNTTLKKLSNSGIVQRVNGRWSLVKDSKIKSNKKNVSIRDSNSKINKKYIPPKLFFLVTSKEK